MNAGDKFEQLKTLQLCDKDKENIISVQNSKEKLIDSEEDVRHLRPYNDEPVGVRLLQKNLFYEFTNSNDDSNYFSEEDEESSEYVSYTDLKFVNLCSKLKADAEEITKLKYEVNIKEELQFKSKSEFSVNVNFQQIIQSKSPTEHSANDDGTSTSYSQYRAILVNNFSNVVNDSEIRDNCSSRVNISAANKNCRNQPCEHLQNDTGSHENTHANCISPTKNDFKCPALSLGNFENEIHDLDKPGEISSNKLDKYRRINNQLIGEIKQLMAKNVKLKTNYGKNVAYCHQLHWQLDIYLSQLHRYKSNMDSKILAKGLKEEVEHLKVVIKNKDLILMDLKKQMSLEVFNKDELLKENVILRRQQMELKDQMNKVYLRESQYQNLRNQFAIMVNKFGQLLISSRNVNNNLSVQNNQILKQNSQLSNELDNLINEISVLTKENESIKLKFVTDENIKSDLKNVIAKFRSKMKDFNHYKSSSEDKINVLNKQLYLVSTELGRKEEIISKINELLNVTKDQRIEMQSRIDVLESQKNVCISKAEDDVKTLEANHLKETDELRKNITDTIQEYKRKSKILERTISEQSKEIINLENNINALQQQRIEIVEYLYKLPTSSSKWTHFFQ